MPTATLTPPATTTTADPTLRLLERFNDPSAWDHVERRVPAFMPHKRTMKGADGKTLGDIDVDLPRLHRIAAELQRMEREDGVVPLLTDGHRIPPPEGTDQTKQPTILGYARCVGVGPSGPKGTPKLLFDEYYLPGRFAIARERPFRSPEFYWAGPNRDRITGIACLEIDPQLSMGMVTYQLLADPYCYHYAMPREEAAMPNLDKSAPNPTDAATGEPTDPSKVPPTAEEAANAKQAAASPAPSPENMAEFQKCMQHSYPHFHAYYNDSIVAKYGAGAMPSGTNGDMPAPAAGNPLTDKKPDNPFSDKAKGKGNAKADDGPPKKKDSDDLDEEMSRMQRTQQDIQLALYQDENAKLRADLAAERAKSATSELTATLARYERDLQTKLALGHKFDLGKTMAHVRDHNGKDKPMTAAQFAFLLDQIAHYERGPEHDPAKPIGKGTDGKPADAIAVYSGNVEGGAPSGAFTEEDMPAAYQLMREQPNLPWERVMEEVVKAKQTKGA